MNTNEEKMTLAQITQQMEETLKEIHKLHNLIKGARLYRDAVIKEHRNMTNEFFDIFEIVVRPLEEAFEATSKKHTALFDLSQEAR